MIATNPLQLIGNTPLLKLSRLNLGENASVYVKLEMFNLTGSVKDRPALSMIETAEREGKLTKDSVLIESTSGNLGLSLAAIARYKGYQFICVADPKIEQSKLNAMRAYGAKIVIVTQADEQGGFQKNRIAKVKELLTTIPNSINLNQYSNPANPLAHYQSTGPEIWKDMNGKINMLVGAVSTGGNLCGSARYLKEKDPSIIVTGVEPEGSVVFGGVYKAFLQQGTGLSFRPDNYDNTLIDKKVKVLDKDAFTTTRQLAYQEGILVGGSSGAVVWAALQQAKTMSKEKNIVAILPDNGDRYLETVFSDEWLEKNNILLNL